MRYFLPRRRPDLYLGREVLPTRRKARSESIE
jgi:hypothetical protein